MVSRCDGNGRRQLNQRILQHVSCTVGILVEQRLPGVSTSSSAPPPMSERDLKEESGCAALLAEQQQQQGEVQVEHQVVAVFLGGADDREAVAYATLLSAHPSVSVSVSRFLLPGEERMTTAGMSEEEAENEEFMVEVRARFVSPGHVSYTDRYVSNGVDTLESLSGMVWECSLFVLGRGGATWMVMTQGIAGLEEEEEEDGNSFKFKLLVLPRWRR